MTVVLVLFVCILDLLKECSFRDVMCRGLKAIAMLIMGGVLYLISMRLVLRFTGIAMHTGDTNSLDGLLTLTPRSLLSLTYGAYRDCLSRLLMVESPYPDWLIRGVTVIQILVVASILGMGLWNKRIKLPEKLLCLVLV